MEFTKNKLLILIWLWSLFCIAITLAITFGLPFQDGFFERVPNFVVIGLWTAIPVLLILDIFVIRVFWVLAVGGGPCILIALFGTCYLIGSKNWKLILLYLFFIFSFIPHMATVFFMRRYVKSCRKHERELEAGKRLDEERARQHDLLLEERARHDDEMMRQEEENLKKRHDLMREMRQKTNNRARLERK